MHRHVENASIVDAAAFARTFARTPSSPATSASSHTPSGRSAARACRMRSAGVAASWSTSNVTMMSYGSRSAARSSGSSRASRTDALASPERATRAAACSSAASLTRKPSKRERGERARERDEQVAAAAELGDARASLELGEQVAARERQHARQHDVTDVTRVLAVDRGRDVGVVARPSAAGAERAGQRVRARRSKAGTSWIMPMSWCCDAGSASTAAKAGGSR